MSDPAFFGYGSLVNTRTHAYVAPRPATLPGWRRTWTHTRLRDVAFLSVRPCADSQIDGLIAHVPGADWAALDERERAYTRIDVTDRLRAAQPTALYQVAEEHQTGEVGPILRSYLDVVVQGYLHHFGKDGVARFFASTDGWHMPVEDDRSAPRYPRAQVLTPEETALVDHHLRRLTNPDGVPG